MTIFQAHQSALSQLRKNETEFSEAPLLARLLLDELASTPHAHLQQPQIELSPSQIAQLELWISALLSGKPLAYILKKRDFYKLRFHSDSRALVPRPETELLVEEVLRRARSTFETTIADLGTGTGCIAISLAHELPNATIIATDVSREAIALAKQNASTLVPASVSQNRLKFVRGVLGDWAGPIFNHDTEYFGPFDFLVSNPPYIARQEIETLQPQVRDFEPRSALDGGEDGLDCYRQIASQCGVLLKPTGVVLCELGMGQFEEVRAIFQGHNWRVEPPIFDFAGIARILVAQPTS